MTTDLTNEYLSTAQAAKLLGVSPNTVRRMVHRDELPAAYFGRGRIILKRDAVEAKAREDSTD
jgi:excisionase family DNA binding protein